VGFPWTNCELGEKERLSRERDPLISPSKGLSRGQFSTTPRGQYWPVVDVIIMKIQAKFKIKQGDPALSDLGPADQGALKTPNPRLPRHPSGGQ
jgi:hypothetical protein